MVGYQEYKDATAKVVSWICETAENNESPTTTSSSKTRASDSRPKHRVSTEEILRQAKHLASLPFTLVMPHTTWKSYKVMLAGRKRYLQLHAGDTKEAESNKGHAYFVRIMHDIQDILKDRVSVQVIAGASSDASKDENRNKRADTTDATIGMLGSLFNKLEVEDADKVDDDIPDDMSEASTTSDTLSDYVPDALPEEDLATEFKFFLAEYQDTKEYVGELWTKTDNTISPLEPVVATFITEAAVVLMGHKEERIFHQKEALSAKYKKDYTHVISLSNLNDPGYLHALTLGDLRRVRAAGKGVFKHMYPVPVKAFSTRHPREDPSRSDKEYAKAKEDDRVLPLSHVEYNKAQADDKALLQLMMELRLECCYYDTRRTPTHPQMDYIMLPNSLDEVSRTLQLINDATVDHNLIKIRTAFAADVALQSARITSDSQALALFEVRKLSQEHDVLATQTDQRTGKNLEQMTLDIHWDILREWVIDMPVQNIRHERLKEKETNALKKRMLEGCIDPSEDREFLFKANGSLCGKLSLACLLIKEELGLSLVNTSPHVFSICFLHKAFSANKVYERNSFGYLPESQGEESDEQPAAHQEFVMKDVEQVCFRHKMEYFGGEFPSEPDRIISLMRLKAGTPVQNMASADIGRSNQPKAAERPIATLKTSEIISILHEYLHEKISFLDMLVRIDKEMQTKETKQHKRKSRLEGKSIISFLTELQPIIQEAVDRMRFDYITLHCASLSLFRRIHEKLNEAGLSVSNTAGLKNIEPKTSAEWREKTWWSYVIAAAALRELDHARKMENNMKRNKLPKAKIETPVLDITVGVLKEYILAGGQGFAD